MCPTKSRCAGPSKSLLAQTILKTLYSSDTFADFHFVFKSGDRIPVHKLLLATASDVFRAMFNGSWIETDEVEIVDASADAFREFLQFFYLGEVQLTIENVSEVMNLGKKYDVIECFNMAGDFLIQNLGNDVCWGYELAVHLEHEKLETFCASIIQMDTQSIFASENFLNCNQRTVKSILQMNSLNCSEVDVFEALIKWMKVQSGQKQLTEEIVQEKFSYLMHEIRFGSMSLNMFLSLDSMYGTLFTRDEYREIVRIITAQELKPKIFKACRRNRFESIQWNENAVIKCNRAIDTSYKRYYIKSVEKTSFTVNKMVKLGAFTCCGLFSFRIQPNGHNKWRELDGKVQSEIRIIEISNSDNSNSNKILYNGIAHLETVTSTRIVLPKPILVRSGVVYQIEMKHTPPINCCTDVQIERKVMVDSDICVEFHDDSIEDGAARGLIVELELNRF